MIARADSSALSRPRILIVDEMPLVRGTLAELLQHCGYATDVAGSAREALLLAQTGRWDAVIIDPGLPDMNGVELYTRLSRDCGRECLPVIFVSGYTGRNFLDAWGEVPRAALLTKPFSGYRLLSALEQCLRGGRKQE